ncbi:MAG: ZIP family metal transporter [Candidatus Lokiarchaeota archaeon]|nr:ZIP family metal transporter [Candidatus Lokiarchaeota archaeon]
MIVFGFLSIFIIGCLSFVGVFMLSMKERTLDGILFVLVAFATGTIFATAILDLIPEAIHHIEEGAINIDILGVFLVVLLGYVIFFVLERFVYWFHGHAHGKDEQMVCYSNITEGGNLSVQKGHNIKTFALLNLMGDGLHNYLDGIVIMVGFLSGVENGIVITLAVLFHELPQEMGDFGILVYGGFSRKKAIFYNFTSAMIALLGGLTALLLTESVEAFNAFMLAFSGGGFLYIASTELMPELLKHKNLKKSILQAVIFVFGILMILSLILLLPHE